MKHATLEITGMSCGHCVSAIRRALSDLPSVKIESIELGRAEVSFDETVLPADRLSAAVIDAGFPTRLDNVGR
jgi:copper chaperone